MTDKKDTTGDDSGLESASPHQPDAHAPAAESPAKESPDMVAELVAVRPLRLELVELADIIESKPLVIRQPKYFTIPYFDKVQYRSDKSLPWVKLEVELMLSNLDFIELPPLTRFHFLSLLILARKYGNRLPNNPMWIASQIHVNDLHSLNISLELLMKSKWIIASKRLKTKSPQSAQSAPKVQPQTETENRQDTDNTENKVVGVVGGSRYSYEVCVRYAQSLVTQGVKNVGGFARSIQRNGEHDTKIEAWMNPAKPQTAAKNYDCTLCHGVGIQVVEGKGARPCPQCRPKKEARA